MKFTTTHPMITHPYHPGLVSGAGVAAVAQAAEQAGFHGIGFTDHPAPSHRWLEAGGHDSLDPFVALSFAAAATERLRLIPNVVVLPYRNPFVVAKAGASLDLLSGGRFTLAVGAGYLKSEFAALGVSHADRNELFDEALRAIHAVWTGDDVTFEGTTFSARGVTAHPRPATDPRPPMWIGGNSGLARQRVADLGDGWAPFLAPAGVAQSSRTASLGTIEDFAAALDDLWRRLDESGRSREDVDVCFSTPAGGSAGSADFDADAHLDGLAELGALGVTWVQVGLPGDSLEHTLEAIEQYGESVIARA